MALTPQRWLAAAVIGALVSVAYFLRTDAPQAVPQDPRSILMDRERSANSAAARAADRLRVVTLADSSARILRALPAGDTIRVLFGRGVGTGVHTAVRNAVAQAHRAIGISSLPVDVVVGLDTGHMVRGVNRGSNPWISPNFVLPATAGDRCLVLLRVNTPDARRESHYLNTLSARLSDNRILGPCAYIAAFGQPGPRVAEWLRSGAWGFALRNEWTVASPPWTPPRWANIRPANIHESLRYHLPTDGIGCLAGRRNPCEGVALNPRPATRFRSRYPDIWAARFVSAGSLHDEAWSRLSLGPQSANLLSDMVHALGRERFQSFWTSPEAVPVAFRDAAGRELGEFTQTWLAGQYGAGLRPGPSLPGSSIPAGLAVLGFGAVAAIFVVRRRQVV